VSAAIHFFERDAVDLHPREFMNHTSGYLALSPAKTRFTVAEIPGLVAYREQGKHLVVMGGVHAPPACRARLLDSFLAEAATRKRRVIVLQLHAEQRALFASRGFQVNQMGTSFGLRLSDFSLAGTRRMKLRHKIKRANEAGMKVLEVGRELPDDDSTYSGIYRISDNWLAHKGRHELAFLIGEIGHSGQTDRRVFVVVDANQTMLGFITYVPVWGNYPGYLHDLTRRLPDAPPGTMELCNAFAIERFRGEGIAHLHFGFTPFIVDESSYPGESRLAAFLIKLIGSYGGRLYPAQSQAMYKNKWAPNIVEREYIAFQKLSLRALLDILFLTRTL